LIGEICPICVYAVPCPPATGPAYAVTRLLARNGLTLKDIDVIELHEAFAGQVRDRGCGREYTVATATRR
jgi:hypothetical protein